MPTKRDQSVSWVNVLCEAAEDYLRGRMQAQTSGTAGK
jgi:hypothetical protein